MTYQKGFVNVGVIVVVLVAMIAGVYFVFVRNMRVAIAPTPSQSVSVSPIPANEIAGWKTYTNTKYGFEVHFPNAWLAPVFQEGKFYDGGAFPGDRDAFWRLLLGSQQKYDCYQTSDGYSYSFEEYPLTEEYPEADQAKLIETLLANDLSRSTTQSYKKDVRNDTTIIWYSESGEGGECRSLNAMIFGTNRVIRLTSLVNKKEEFDQILSTFKFTK